MDGLVFGQVVAGGGAGFESQVAEFEGDEVVAAEALGVFGDGRDAGPARVTNSGRMPRVSCGRVMERGMIRLLRPI